MSTQNDAEMIKGFGMELDALADQLKRQIAELEAAGIHDATYYYRDGKYMYVNYSEHGIRVRAYIGTDPDKQARAIADIERFKERAALLGRLDELQQRREQLDYELQWLRSRYQELAKRMVTPGRARAAADVTNGDAGGDQADWIRHHMQTSSKW